MSDYAALAHHDARDAGDGELLPLLPLPHMVLLPGEELQLHVFAARYCALVREALAAAGRLVVSAIRREDLADPPEHPAVERVACCARISHAQELADGSFIIFLEGQARVLLGEAGMADGGFRCVHAVAGAPSGSADLCGTGPLGRDLASALPLLLDDDPEERREVAELLPAADADGVIALAARALELDRTAKQALLEAPSRAARCLSVGAALAERVQANGGETLLN